MKIIKLTLLILILSSCTKHETAKPISIENNEQLSKLKTHYPGLNINLTNATEKEQIMLNSNEGIETYVDSLFQEMQSEVSTIEADYDIPYSSNMFGCGAGSIISAYSGGAGMLSSFQASFQYKNGGVSNLSFSTNGLRIWGGNFFSKKSFNNA